jgi:GntR family transcriptional regulator/MocR family aminotransferase
MKRVGAGFLPLIAIDRTSSPPLYRQLYHWFRQAIVSGQLRPGQRIPSTRALAAELRISRLPVLNAFAQLHAEGFLETRVGSGTMVSPDVPGHARGPGASGRLVSPQGGTSGTSVAPAVAPPPSWSSTLGPFRVSLPALEHFPMRIWSRLVARHARNPRRESLAYGDPMGYLPFRQAIAEYLGAARGVRCDVAQVMVVAGSQQGLQLAARVLLASGDRVWMEEPGYPGAHQALTAAGARITPVPVDQDGLKVEDGIRLARDARAVYVTPSHQYPLGATMGAARRLELLQWAAGAGAWIVEDDYDSEYRFGARPVAALQGLDAHGRVIYAGTLSKVLFPALRIGYLVLPIGLVPAFAAAREVADIFSATLYQAALTDFLREGHFARHLRRMRALYLERREALAAALARHLGGELEIVGSEAGMHLTALLEAGVDDRAVSEQGARHGLSLMPLSLCHLHPAVRGGLILGYGGSSPSQTEEGIRRLKLSLQEVGRHAARARRPSPR